MFIITTHETIEDLWDGRPSLHRDYTNEIKIEEIKNWVPAIIEDIDETVKFLTNVKNMKDHNDIIKNVKKSWSISEEISNFFERNRSFTMRYLKHEKNFIKIIIFQNVIF